MPRLVVGVIMNAWHNIQHSGSLSGERRQTPASSGRAAASAAAMAALGTTEKFNSHTESLGSSPSAPSPKASKSVTVATSRRAATLRTSSLEHTLKTCRTPSPKGDALPTPGRLLAEQSIEMLLLQMNKSPGYGRRLIAEGQKATPVPIGSWPKVSASHVSRSDGFVAASAGKYPGECSPKATE